MPARAAIEKQPVKQPEPAEEKVRAPVLTRPPELVEFRAATYPSDLLAQGTAGEVLLVIDIDARGLVERVEVKQASHPAFAGPALHAAAGFVFTPAEVDDKPSPIRLEYRYVFEPRLVEPDAISGAAPDDAYDEAVVNYVGLVREAGNRKPIAGIRIAINDVVVAETDAQGHFEVRGAPVGTFTARISSPYHVAYEVEEEVGAYERIEVNYYLRRISFDPYETVVRGRQERREVAKVQLERRELEKIPGTFGDPVRVIENLPGMARTPGGLGGTLLVRGSRPADSGVFFDGVDVPLLFHFGGLTSIVPAEFLDRIDFYPGGFGARYGHATAGIVDVTTRDLDCDIVHGSLEVDLLDAAVYACAPVGDWRVAAATRRSYIDAILPAVLKKAQQQNEGKGVLSLAPAYWDYQAKANTNFGDQSLHIFVFGSDDRLKLVQSGSQEDLNVQVGTHLTFHRLLLRHRIRLGSDLTLMSSLAPGYEHIRFGQQAEEIDFDAGFGLRVAGVEWREEVKWELLEGLTLHAGIDVRLGWAKLRIEAPIPTELRIFPSPVYDITDTEVLKLGMGQYHHGYWLELDIELISGLKILPGLRLDRFHLHKTKAWALQPRVSTRWDVIEGTTLKAAYGLYRKLPEPNYLIDSLGNPDLPPELAHQIVVGLEQAVTRLIHVDLQGFYTLRSKLVSPSQTVTYEDGRAEYERWAPTGTGRSYGLELLVRHLATANGWFYGWIAYTLSRSELRDRSPDTTYMIQGAQGGGTERQYSERSTQTYLSPFDQTHILTVVAQFILPWGIEAGARFRLVSGNPYTPLREGRVSWDADPDSYRLDLSDVRRNSGRMPMFHQLDLRIDKTWVFDLWKLSTYLEVINVYNAKNVEMFRYGYRYEQRRALSLLPVVPILGIKGEF